jgi:ABC-type xylose transport system permease subunit
MSTVAVSRIQRLGTRAAPLAGLAAVVVLAAITAPGVFGTDNLRLILFQAGLIGITAIGQTLVLLVAGIDLSIGAVIGLTTVIVASHTDGRDGALPVAILLAVLAGLAVGMVNAGLVVIRRVPPFVATFATFVLVQGAITAATRGAPSGEIPEALAPLGADLALNVSSLHEMRPDQIAEWFRIIDRHTRGRFYTKQWVRSINDWDQLVVERGDYPVPPHWKVLLDRPAYATPGFFEAVYQLAGRPA